MDNIDNNIISHNELKTPLFSITIDMDKLEHLRLKHKNEKFSYADAFVYLLLKAASSCKSQNGDSSKDFTPLLTTNFSELANDWHWDRATVRHFIEQSQELGLLLFDRQGKKVDIYIVD